MTSINVKYEDFNEVFNVIIGEIKEEPTLVKSNPATVSRCVEVFNDSVPHRSDKRGFIIAKAYCCLMGDKMTRSNLHLAYVLGWLAQALSALTFLIDDFLDNDMIRWGQPTWYAKREMSKYTVVDALNLESVVYSLLKKHFYHLPIYNALVDYFQEMKFGFFLGQTMEELSLFKNDPCMTYSNIDNYKARTTLTNLRCTFSVYFHLPMILAGLPTCGKVWDEIDSFCLPLLHYCVLRNDLHDSFQTYQGMLKVPSNRDIRQGLGKYLFIKAKELCTPEQLGNIKKSYGVDDEENAELVKKIYCDLGIPILVKNELDKLKSELEKRLSQYNNHVFAELFELVLNTFITCADI